MVATRRSTGTGTGAGKGNGPSTSAWRRPSTRPDRLFRITLIVLGVWSMVQSIVNAFALASMNFKGETPGSFALRGTATTTTTTTTSEHLECPALPERLQTMAMGRPPYSPVQLTKEEVDHQLQIMIPNKVGTTGNQVFVCPANKQQKNSTAADDDTTECRGVVKVYRSRAVYHHVKRCLLLLAEDTTSYVTSPILYADDASATMVEANAGPAMSISTWPDDFEPQLRRIMCLLRRQHMIHRDLNWQNFVVDETTGRIYIIDFGDAFVWQSQPGDTEEEGGAWRNWQNYQRRNLVNLFNIWWKQHDEQQQLEDLIAKIKFQRKRNKTRIWKAPVSVV